MHLRDLTTGIVVSSAAAGVDACWQVCLWAWQTGSTGGFGLNLSDLSSTAMLAGITWYTVTRAMPALQKEFGEQLKSQRSDFRDELTVQRTAFEERLAQLRKDHESDRFAFMKCTHERTNPSL